MDADYFLCSSFFQGGKKQLCKMTVEIHTDSVIQEKNGLGLFLCLGVSLISRSGEHIQEASIKTLRQ